MRHNLSSAILRVEHDTAEQRRIRNITAYLMAFLHIPDGTHLIMVFGDGCERSNREAIEHWVARILPEIDAEEAEERLRRLCREAHCRLNNFIL